MLRNLVLEQLDAIKQRDRTIHHRETKIAKLTAEIARLRRVQFAAKSERMDPDQRELFDEAMAADIAAAQSELDALRTPDTAKVPRKTPQRRALPADLPRIETRHERQSCDCATCGRAPVAIGEHVSGVVGLRLQPLVDTLHARLLTEPILHADETPVAQLDPGAGKVRRAYLFAYRSAGVAPIVVFDYGASRAGKHARAFLGEYQGALMVDDYAGYKALFDQGITELGCWAHARRKFFDAHQASASPLATEAIRRIAALCRIEASARDMTPAARGNHRQRHATPLLEDLKRWLDTLRPNVLGNTGLHRAIEYTLKRWPALVLSRRRPLPDRQQPDRERDPADCRRAQELAVRRLTHRRPARRRDHEPARHRQGQRPRTPRLAHRRAQRAHAAADHQGPRHRDLAADTSSRRSVAR